MTQFFVMVVGVIKADLVQASFHRNLCSFLLIGGSTYVPLFLPLPLSLFLFLRSLFPLCGYRHACAGGVVAAQFLLILGHSAWGACRSLVDTLSYCSFQDAAGVFSFAVT